MESLMSEMPSLNGNGECDALCVCHETGASVLVPADEGRMTVSMCVSGSATIYVRDRSFSIVPGTMVFKLPATASYCVVSRSADYESWELRIPRSLAENTAFDLKGMAAEMALMARMPVRLLDGRQCDDFMNWVELIRGLLPATGGGYRARALQTAVVSLLYFVCDVLGGEDDQQKIMAENDRSYRYFVNFLDLLGKHCVEERSVAFYADKLFITPKYLSSVIKEVSGRTAGEWIDEFVMAEAKMMLQHTDNNISETAYKLNFPSTSFFGKYFKRHTGMSPSSFRRTLAAV